MKAMKTWVRRSYPPLGERLWSKTDMNGPTPIARPDLGPCWLWTGAKYKNGYGHISFNGKTISTHRAAWIVAYGYTLGGLNVCHKCDNRACIRPAHLFPGTQSDNLLDMVRKGRFGIRRHNPLRGERSPNAKLTDAIVRRMVALRSSGKLYREIGAMFGVHENTASKVVRRIKWRHVAI